MMAGNSPLQLTDATGASNPVLTAKDVTDLNAAFLADPFLLRAGGTWYMFFEALEESSDRGVIALAASEDGRAWRYQQVVLAEEFHLSYPCVFESGGEYFMIPETLQPRAIRLYQAVSFPTHWRFAANLLEMEAADPTILRHDGTWWLFACTRRNDQLSVYYADELAGPWRPHPGNPVVENIHGARPGGRVVSDGGKLFRFGQDCSPRYGSNVRAFEILTLTRDAYRERECAGSPVMTPSGTGWNGSRMHHLDAHRLPDETWIACVDGC
jgi:hypothetical protein